MITNNVELAQKFSSLSHTERLSAFKMYVSNRKLNDKFSLAYIIEMIDRNVIVTHALDIYKRQELLDRLFGLLDANETNLDKVIRSEHTMRAVVRMHDATTSRKKNRANFIKQNH